MPEHRPISHVIFDMDGLLLDTERLATQANQVIASEYGKLFTYDIKEKCLGRGEKEVAKTIIECLDLPLEAEEFLSKIKLHLEKILPSAQLMPGAERLVRHFAYHSIPIAIATGSSKWKYDLKTSHHQEFFNLFHHKVFASQDPEVHQGKPAPDCFLIAANRFPDSPLPEKVLVFEDSGNGVIAAYGAGMQCVWVPDPRANTTRMAHKATETICSLEEFRPEDYGLPPFQKIKA